MNSKTSMIGRNFLKQSVIWLIIGLVVGIGLNVLIYYFYSSKATVVDEYEMERDRLQRRISVLEQRKESPVIKQADIEKLLVRMPVEAQLTPYLTALTENEKTSGAAILNLSVADPVEMQITETSTTQDEEVAQEPEASAEPNDTSDDAPTAPPAAKILMSQSVSLSLQGELNQLKQYLDSLLRSERLTVVDALSINVNNEGLSGMTLNLKYYWAPKYAEILTSK